jgi:hypothetical protein
MPERSDIVIVIVVPQGLETGAAKGTPGMPSTITRSVMRAALDGAFGQAPAGHTCDAVARLFALANRIGRPSAMNSSR